MKKDLGQFFTPKDVASFMIELSSKDKNADILEPCAGEGVFIEQLLKKGYKNITAIEYDTSLIQKNNFPIENTSFVTKNFNKKFDLIIGNPPYIRWRNINTQLKKELNNNELWQKFCNNLCDYLYIFILKSINLLKEDGELIFITPEYWLHTTHSQSLRNYLIENGYFEHLIFFKETPIFDKVNSSIIIFKYIKNKNNEKQKFINFIQFNSRKKLNSHNLEQIKNILLNNKKYNDSNITFKKIPQFKNNSKWLLADEMTINNLKQFENKCFSNLKNKIIKLKDIADIGNGLVSGLDKAFKLTNIEILNEKEKQHILNVLKAKNLNQYYYTDVSYYIFLHNYKNELNEEILKKEFPNFYNQLISYKQQLLKRYSYGRDIKFWEWAFLRNYNLFSKKTKKIFVPCKERISNKNYFRFCLAEENFFPTQDVTGIVLKENIKENIYYILALLNSKLVFNWINYNGIVKGNIVEFSEKPLSSIPIRLIDWEKKEEIKIHDNIVSLSQEFIKTKNKKLLFNIDSLIYKLFS